MKKFLAILLAALMLFSLTACGGDKDSVAAADPNLGLYKGVHVVTFGVEMPFEEVYGEGNSIELKDGGKAEFNLGGDSMKCDWELKCEELTVTVEGVPSSGTLKDGVMSIDFMNMGIEMVFAKEGVTVESSASSSEEPAAVLDGFYPVYSAVIGGNEIDYETLVIAEVAESYIIFNTDGTGEVYFQDSESDTFTYDMASGILTDSSGMEFAFYADGDAVTVEFPLQDMTMTYVLDASAMWDGLEPGETAGSITDIFGGGATSQVYIEAPSVWYGWMSLTDFWGIDQEEAIYDCWGYVDTDSNGRTFFEVYQDGYPEDSFFSMYADINDGLFLDPIIGDEDAWISDTYIDPENDDTMYEGRLIRNNTLVFEFPYVNYSGDYGCTVSMCFRLDGQLWDEENDVLPPRYEEYKAAIIAEGGAEGDSASNGGSAGAVAFSGPTTEFDYNAKGEIFFDYPSSCNYEKKFGVETIKTADESVKITFVADWGMDDYAARMEGYEKYVAESNGVIEDGLSYGGYDAVRVTWENALGDVTQETYILFGEGAGQYVGINVAATAGSQSAIDGAEIEAILHSVRLP